MIKNIFLIIKNIATLSIEFALSANNRVDFKFICDSDVAKEQKVVLQVIFDGCQSLRNDLLFLLKST